MVTDSDNSKNNNFKNENVMEAQFLKRLKWTLIAAWLLYVMSLNKANAADYYWVGGTGNWNDVSHWTTSSGGTTFHTQPPTANDDVYFDANSFTASGQNVIVNQSINFCSNFSWQNTLAGTDLITTDTTYQIKVLGSLSVDSPLSFYGTFSFESPSQGNTINIADTVSCIIAFDNSTGAWNLSAHIKSKSKIKLLAGTFNTNNFNITCAHFISNYFTPGRSLNLGTTTFLIKDFEYEQSLGNQYEAFASFVVDTLVNVVGSSTKVLFEIPDYADTTNIFPPPGTFNTVITFNGGNHDYSTITGAAPYNYGSHYVGMSGNIEFGNSVVGNVFFNNMTYAYITSQNLTVDTIKLAGVANPWLEIGGNFTDIFNANYIEAYKSTLVLPRFVNINKWQVNGDCDIKMFNLGGLPNNTGLINNLNVGGDFDFENAELAPWGYNSPHIVKCVLNGNGTFTDYCSFDTLMFAANKNYTIDAGDSIRVNNQFIATGSAGNFIGINSDNNGSQTTINFTNGNVCTNYLNLGDINAVGTNIIAGANSIDLGNNTGWQFAPCSPPSTYYWVGGTGNWSDVSHWATTSGGTTFHTQPPTTTDDVYFDANSFTASGQIVSITPSAQCKNFDAQSVGINTNFVHNNSISVSGSFLLSPNVTWSGNGSLFFKNGGGANTVSTPNNSLGGSSIFFQSQSSSWNVLTDLSTTGTINVDSGIVTFNNIVVNANELRINTLTGITDSVKVFLGTSNFNLSSLYFVNTPPAGNVFIDGSNASIVVSGPNPTFTTTPAHYHYIECAGEFNSFGNGSTIVDSLIVNSANAANLIVDYLKITGTPFALPCGILSNIGNPIIKKLELASQAPMNMLANHLFVDTLTMSNPTGVLNFLSNDTVTVNHQITSASFAGNLFTIQNTAGTTYFDFAMQQPVCIDYLNLQNINAINNNSVYAGSNSNNLGGNTGWNFATCPPQPVSYYWVGGTGNWSDVSHWATTSGGTTFHTTPPDSTSDVYFDGNSSLTTNDTIYTPSSIISCRNFTSANITSAFHFGYPFSLITVHGSLNINPYLVFISAAVNMLSNNSGNTIQTNGNNSISNLVFTGGGEWSLLDSLYVVSNISISDFCTVNLNSNNITSGVDFNLSPQAILNTGSATLTAGEFYFDTGIVNGTGSRLITTTGGGASYLNGTGYDIIINNYQVIGNFTCNKIYCYYPGGQVYGNFNSNYLECYNHCYLDSSGYVGRAVIYDDADIGNLTFDTLILYTPGSSIRIMQDDTITINNALIANSVSGNTISISTLPAGSSGYINKSSGQICLQNISLQNINTTGGAQFFAGNGCIDLGGNTGWIWAPCSPSAPGYYWVGGTGNWSDFANHWATTSGGTTFHSQPPGPNDDVYFDANSFTSNSDTVKVIGAFATCNSFNWDVPQLAPVIIGSSIPLTIAGDLNLQSNFDWQVSDLRLTSSNGTILTNGNKLFSVTIDNNSTYQLADDIKCGYLDLLNTNFNSNNRTLTVGNIDCRQSPIEFGTSIINIVNDTNSFGLWSKIGDSTNVSNATINLYKNGGWLNFNNTKMNAIKEINVFANSSGVNSLITGPFNCGKLIADQIVSITPQLFMGNRSFINKAVFKNNVYLNTGIIIDTLLLDNPGYTTQLTSGDTLFINNAFFSSYSSGLFGLITSTLPTYISMNNGIVCLNNISLQNINTIGGAQFFAGNGCVDLGGNTGWQFAPCSIVSDVWPGDANYDLTVNNYDVLNIGLAYGNTGPLRTGASLAYVAQPATDWSGYFANAVNHKHSDTNGDGVVDNNDTAAISLNYGLTHPARLAGNTQQTFTGPQLYLQASADSVAEGDTVEFDIYFGDAVSPINNIYGLAFTINVDTTFVDTVYSNFDFTGCWMGTEGVDLLTYNHPVWSQNKIDVALTRTTQTDTSGYGYLGRVGVVIVDNVGARILSPGYVTMPVSISNVYGIDYAQNALSITTLGDSVVIDTAGTVNINNIVNLNNAIDVFPNPTKDKINVRSSKINIESAELINTLGSVLIQTKAESNSIALNLELVRSGIYVLRIKTDKGVLNKKVQVIKYK